eukprot:1792338-Rhodomonas_salina.1
MKNPTSPSDSRETAASQQLGVSDGRGSSCRSTREARMWRRLLQQGLGAGRERTAVKGVPRWCRRQGCKSSGGG